MEKDWVQVGTESERGKIPLTSSAGGWMLTAGSDRIIRFWDLGRLEKSSTVSPNDIRGEYK
jgi:WD40 repeat protein